MKGSVGNWAVVAETGSLEALAGVGGCHVCEVDHCWNKGIHESGYRSRKELRRRDSKGGHARNWTGTAELTIRYLRRLASPFWFDAVVGWWISGPVTYIGRARLRGGSKLQTKDKLPTLVQTSASGSATSVTPRSLLHLIW